MRLTRCAHGNQHLPSVKIPAERRECQDEEGPHGIRGHAVQLLLDDAVVRVYGPDDRGQEEGEALDGDVVEEENNGDLEGDGVGHAAGQLGAVHAVEDLSGANTLRLDTSDTQFFFFLGEPAGCFRAVGEGKEGDEG